MPGSTTLIVLSVIIVGCVSSLWFLQRRWALDSVGQAAGEAASRLIPTPVRTRSSLRRRFARAVTSQRVLMPSGQVVAATHLHLRIAPEDVSRLSVDDDLDALALDAATMYLRHAQRESWQVLAAPEVTISIDPVLRSGWVPLAQVTRSRLDDVDGRATAVMTEPVGLASRASRADLTYSPRQVATAHGMQPVGGEVYKGTLGIRQRSAGADATALTRADATVMSPGPRPAALVLAETDSARTYEIPAPRGTVGRLTGCTVVLDDQAVSREHARFERRNGGWWLTDLGSSNGTYVNGERLARQQAHELHVGDEVRFTVDGSTLRVRMPLTAL
ncbi:MAG: FHA domain-containing protein [Actinomycetota bacterium]|nr:FHA domain-containing protein [Actinomycetota bacterium]